MENNVNNCGLSCVGRAAGYAIYNLGLTFAVGLVRLAVAVYYLVKHLFCAKMYEQAAQLQIKQNENALHAKQNERSKENAQARRETKEAKGVLNTLGAIANEITVKTVNTVEDMWDKGENYLEEKSIKTAVVLVTAKEKALMEVWKEQAIRGLVELVPILGSGYYTYQDNFGERDVSVFCIKELAQQWEFEQDLSDMLDGIFNAAPRLV